MEKRQQLEQTSKEGVCQVSLSGFDLINSPRLNKGTAFSAHERDVFDLHGLLPPHIGTLDEQIERRTEALADESTPFTKYSLLRNLQDTNETLFYALLVRNIEEMLPLVYTPTVGEGCQRFSEIWRKPRGLFLSYPNKDRIDRILSHSRYDDVKCIVVSDGERILGLGDQGAGGMGIPIGKMALYTALGGIHPENCLPILLDVGTDNEDRLNDPIYVGWRHHRVRGAEYDAFVDEFVNSVKKRWPHVLLQWEDFAGSNAARFLASYRDQLCTFNDDIQGTAAVAAATLISAIHVTGVPLEQQKIVILGFGSAGLGITSLLAQFMQDKGLTGAGGTRALLRYRSLRSDHGKQQGCAARSATLRAQRTGSAELEDNRMKRSHCWTWSVMRSPRFLSEYLANRAPFPKKRSVRWQSIVIALSSSRCQTPPRAVKRLRRM